MSTGKVVTNDLPRITLDFSWRAYHRPGAPDLYPQDRREEIDAVMAPIYEDVNNGVYRCGFAGSQARGFDDEGARLPTGAPVTSCQSH